MRGQRQVGHFEILTPRGRPNLTPRSSMVQPDRGPRNEEKEKAPGDLIGLLGKNGVVSSPNGTIAGSSLFGAIDGKSTSQDSPPATMTLYGSLVDVNGNALSTGSGGPVIIGANIQFGNGFAVSAQIPIAVGQGISFPVPGTAWQATFFTNNQTPVAVGGFMTKWPKPRFTFAAPVLAAILPQQINAGPGSSLDFVVPPFAVAFNFGRIVQANSYTVGIRGNNGTGQFYTVGADETPPWVALPQGANDVLITNNGAALDQISPMFALDF